jgi:hypothetical protein
MELTWIAIRRLQGEGAMVLSSLSAIGNSRRLA